MTLPVSMSTDKNHDPANSRRTTTVSYAEMVRNDQSLNSTPIPKPVRTGNIVSSKIIVDV